MDAPLEPRPTLYLATNGDGDGIVLVDGKEVKGNESFLCQPGVEVILEARPGEDSVFAGWNIDEEKEKISVIMDQNHYISAEFNSNL